jgi:hypothetical protein
VPKPHKSTLDKWLDTFADTGLSLSLYELDKQLTELWDIRDAAEESLEIALREGDLAETVQRLTEEIAAIDAAMKLYFEALPKKVDSVADAVHALDRLAGEPKTIKGEKVVSELDREIKRLIDRRDRMRKRLESIKTYALFVLQAMEWPVDKPRKLEGIRHSISLRGNGGLQPLVITDETLLPDELLNVRLVISRADWLGLTQLLEEDGIEYGDWHVDVFPSNERIREALGKPCAVCLGIGTKDQTAGEMAHALRPEPCPECLGAKTASVPGCRLEPRGESVVVK